MVFSDLSKKCILQLPTVLQPRARDSTVDNLKSTFPYIKSSSLFYKSHSFLLPNLTATTIARPKPYQTTSQANTSLTTAQYPHMKGVSANDVARKSDNSQLLTTYNHAP